jgi:hypothetical protein
MLSRSGPLDSAFPLSLSVSHEPASYLSRESHVMAVIFLHPHQLCLIPSWLTTLSLIWHFTDASLPTISLLIPPLQYPPPHPIRICAHSIPVVLAAVVNSSLLPPHVSLH